jgi:4-amino-4-deoxy-L-arabinose transferase-like glycosyltransferase
VSRVGVRDAEARLHDDRRAQDRIWLAVLAASFAFGLAVSWQRWGNPLIDTGREMNQPLRLATGEMLYSDVRHIYGPLSPWLHAVVFRVVGPSLDVLYADGILTAAAIVVLLYWLGRRIMRPAAAGAAALSMMWLCMFKPAGNYILPYSYNSLHGVLLGLSTLAVLIAAVPRTGDVQRPVARFVLAGALAGLTLLAKTEMGLAAVAAGVTAAVLAAYPDARRGAALAAAFVLPAASLPAAVYAAIAARVGWSTLVGDSWLLLYNLPPELAFFNGWVSGFDNPGRSLMRMAIAAVKLGMLAAVIGAASTTVAGNRPPWRLVAGVLALGIVMSLTTGLDIDKGPYLAMPFLLVGMLVALVHRLRSEGASAPSARTSILIVCAVYALVSLARMILRVRSGGAYASYLLPVSVVLFTYLWVGPFAGLFRQARARRAARTIVLALIVGNAVATAAILGYRYQTRHTVRVATDRGAMTVEPDVGRAWNEALAYIDRYTRPADPVAVLPEGTSLNFLSGRKNPLRDEIVIPGVLDAPTEAQTIRRLQHAGTRLILITNRPTAEFGPAAFGRDYGRRLMEWIESHYTTCAMFGPVKDPELDIGDEPFFIRAYCATRGPQLADGG